MEGLPITLERAVVAARGKMLQTRQVSLELSVKQVRTRSERKAFVRLPNTIMGDDPCWAPPLESERLDFIDPRVNPFFRHGEAALFLAYRGGNSVGRISAQVDFLQEPDGDGRTGLFGFFDAIDDAEVVSALVAASRSWLRSRDCAKMVGPFTFTINGESGVLVEGFDTPPFIIMNHNPPYYGARLEEQGLRKAKDLYAWHCGRVDIPERNRLAALRAREMRTLTLRNMDFSRLHDEARHLAAIANSTLSGNWGFIPFAEEDLYCILKELRPIADPALMFFAEINGEPAAVSISLPNVNEFLRDLRAGPALIRQIRLAWRLAIRRPTGARVALLGVSERFRGRRDFAGLSLLIYAETQERLLAAGYREFEFSWTLEDNTKIHNAIRRVGGRLYKVYRTYETTL